MNDAKASALSAAELTVQPGTLSADDAMVVHTRARALLEWLVPQAAGWPREHRHTLSRHICDLAIWLHDALIAARHLDLSGRADALRDADIHLDQLRQYLHLTLRWQWLSGGQFEHVSRLTEELGRLIGGWRRGTAVKSGSKKWAAPGWVLAHPKRSPNRYAPQQRPGPKPWKLPGQDAPAPFQGPGARRAHRNACALLPKPGQGMWQHNRRKPRLLFLLSGRLPLRIAGRQLYVVLCHEPPRPGRPGWPPPSGRR